MRKRDELNQNSTRINVQEVVSQVFIQEVARIKKEKEERGGGARWCKGPHAPSPSQRASSVLF